MEIRKGVGNRDEKGGKAGDKKGESGTGTTGKEEGTSWQMRKGER